MDKWFENKDKKYKIRYKEKDLDDYAPEISHNKREMGLAFAFIFIALTILIVWLFVKGFEVAFVVIPFPLWCAWKSLKIWMGKE